MKLCILSSHHQQALVGINDPEPNGHVGVFTVLQEGTDGDVSAFRVRLWTKRERERREKYVTAISRITSLQSHKCLSTLRNNQNRQRKPITELKKKSMTGALADPFSPLRSSLCRCSNFTFGYCGRTLRGTKGAQIVPDLPSTHCWSE